MFVGLGLIGASVFALVQKFSTVTYLATISHAGPGDPAAISFHERYGLSLEPKLYLMVEMPRFIYAGGSRTIKATLDGFSGASDGETILLEAYEEAPEFQLAISGAEVRPTEWITLRPKSGSPAVWWVRGREPGSFEMAMSARLKPRDFTEDIARLSQGPNHQLTVAMLQAMPTRVWTLELGSASESKMILVKRHSWADYLGTAARAVVGIVGILLALPGIVVLMRKRGHGAVK